MIVDEPLTTTLVGGGTAAGLGGTALHTGGMIPAVDGVVAGAGQRDVMLAPSHHG